MMTIRPTKNTTPPSLLHEEMMELVRPKSRRSGRNFDLIATVIKPEKSDVLCGRGRGFFEHPGNRRMLSIIAKFKPEYQAASKIQKSAITQRVLEIILEPRDGEAARPRFLKRATSGRKGFGSFWEELSEKEVHMKVAHTLREQKGIVCLPERIASSDCGEEEEDAECGPTTNLIRFVSTDSSISAPTGKQHLEPNMSIATKPTSPGPLGTAHVSDDEEASSSTEMQDIECNQRALFRMSLEGKSGFPELVLSLAEPLSYQQEPMFNEKEIDNLLHTVLDDDDADDVILDSFLAGLDLFNSSCSLTSI